MGESVSDNSDRVSESLTIRSEMHLCPFVDGEKRSFVTTVKGINVPLLTVNGLANPC